MGSHGSDGATESLLGDRKPQNDPIRGVPNQGREPDMAVGASEQGFGAHCGSVGTAGGCAAAATQVTPGP